MTYIDNIYTKYLLCILSLYLFISIPCLAQEQTGTLSGTVLDKNEEPVQGFTLALSNGPMHSKTNEKGEFTFNNIPNIPIQFTIPSNLYKDEKGNYSFKARQWEPDYEVISTKIGKITIHKSKHSIPHDVKFSVKPGTHLQNVVVIVRPRARIRTRVVLKDGTPLANTSISTIIESVIVIVENGEIIKNLGGMIRSIGNAHTDSEGYFVHYIRPGRIPAEYTISVSNKELTTKQRNKLIKDDTSFDDLVKSKNILIEDGTRIDDLVLTLDSEAKVKSPSLPSLFGKLSRKPKQVQKTVVRESVIQEKVIQNVEVKELPVNPPKVIEKPRITIPESDEKTTITQPIKESDEKTKITQLIKESDEKTTITQPIKDLENWLVNPENGHAYRKIQCRSLKEARNQAASHGAYLVAINDENEQKWLSGVFGNHLYWIGLSDAKTEGQWVWENGEPLTYSNWGKKGMFPRSTLTTEQQDAAIMTFVNGLWQAIGSGDLFWQYTKNAIIERDEL